MTPAELQAIKERIEIARACFGDGFDEHDGEPRRPHVILSDLDRQALYLEVLRLSARVDGAGRRHEPAGRVRRGRAAGGAEMTHDELYQRWHADHDALLRTIGGLQEEKAALSAKLEEAQAEIAAAREACPSVRLQDNFDAPLLHLVQCEVSRGFNRDAEIARLAGLLQASPGEVIRACPNCGAHEPKEQVLAWIVTGRPGLVCAWCRHEFTEPAYFQRVTPQKGSR